MKANLGSMARRWLSAAAVGGCLSLAGVTAWSQEAPPPAPDDAKGAAEEAKGESEEATAPATDAAKKAKGAASDAAKGAKGAAEGAKEAAESDPFAQPGADATKGTARDATGTARAGARDAARETREDTRDASRDSRERARDTTRDLREGTQEEGREAREESRDLREGTRDATRDLREGARDTARDFREGAQDARREAREETRDLREGTRDTTRDLREGARDARESFREERADVREDVRRPRQDTDLRDDERSFRDDRSELRDDRSELRDERSELRDERSFRDDRSESRDEFREGRDLRDSARSRDSFRESSRSSVRTDTRINTETLRPADLGIWFSRSTRQGLVISDVATSGPMGTLISEFGFREGDQIVSVDGYRVSRDADFIRYLLADEILYERVPVVVTRGGRRTTLYVEPIRLVEQVQTVQVDPLEQFGIILDDRSTDRVLVWRVIPRSPAFYAGIQPGDVITTFHGQRVTSPDAFVQIVERVEPGTIAVEVNRNQRVRQLDVELAEIESRGAVRSSLRPEFDDPSIERFSERREDRIEDRREMRFDGDGYVVPPTRAPAPGPVRRAIFPRLRGR